MRHLLVNIFSASLIAILLIATPFSVASAVAGVPTVISYQGRLTDANGILLGGTSGTNYYFKFSIWDSAAVGGGTRLWPASAPGTISLPVTEGVFNVNIGDTGTGYPDALTYNFQDNDTVYLQVEVSTNGSSFETPGPRQRITSSGTAINAKTLGGNLPSYFLDANNLTNFQTPFNTALAGVTADAVAEGTLNKYFTSTLFDSSFATKTSDNLTEGATNKYFTASNFNTSFATKSTTDLTEGSNLYYTDVRARAALSATGPITYDNITGVIGIGMASSTTDGSLTATDWNTFNTKQNAITTGTSAQYLRGDLSLGTFPTVLSAFTNDQGFLTSVSNGDILAAIGYTPYDATNPDGYISGIVSGDITTALGYTPYDDTNPAGYITASSADSLTNKTGDISQWTNDTGYLTSASLFGYVPTTRTLTINGVGYDLTTDQSWTVGDVFTGGSYSDPSWITSLDWSKIASLPSTLSGYGITDAVPDTRTINGYALSSDIALTKSDLSLGNVEDTALSTWVGSTNITTLGTIATGVWQGTAIADGYIASASTWNAKENALTFSTGLTRTGDTITNNLSTGVSGGQSVIGGTGSGENLTLSSTSNATKGKILFGTSAYNEANNRLGIGTTSPSAPIHTVSASGAVAAIFQTGASSGFNIRSYGTGSSQDTLIYPISSTAGAANDFILGNTTNNTWLNAASASNAILLGLATNIRATIELNRINFGTSTLISSGSAYITPTSLLEVKTNALGVTQTTSSGLALTNTTAAALAAQQISPALRFSGNGWKTAATAASQAVNFRNYNLPVQGVNNPTGILKWDYSVNGGAYADVFTITPSSGRVTVFNSIFAMSLVGGASGSIATEGSQNINISPNNTPVLTAAIGGNVGIGQTVPTSKLDVTTNSLGTTQTTSSGLALVNTTAAAAGAQQISPALRWSANGWKTNATAASQAVDFRSYVLPTQGSTQPTGELIFESAINSGSYQRSVSIVDPTAAAGGDSFRVYGNGTQGTMRIYVGQASSFNQLGIGVTVGESRLDGVSNIISLATNSSPRLAVFPTTGFVSIAANANSASSRLEVRTLSLGTTQTTDSGLALTNTTAAAAGAQQISPALRWSANGWKTNATAASQAVDFRSYVLPTQGSTQPTGELIFESAINSGSYQRSVSIVDPTAAAGGDSFRVYGNGTQGTMRIYVGQASSFNQLGIGVTVGESRLDGVSNIISLATNSSPRLAVFPTTGFVSIAANANSASSRLEVRTLSLGTTQTTDSGLALTNTTAAAAGAQQISPALRWTGQGWKTNATAASQSVDFRAFVTPVQGTANPTGYLGFGSSINSGAYSDGQMVLTSAGNVGISNTAPGYLLHVGSSSTSSGTTVARFENAGGTCDVTPNLVSGVVCTSDERFKENVATYEGSLDQVLALRPVSYALISDPTHETQVGFLAQEMEQVLPGLVRTDAQGNKAVLYAGLTPVLVGAIKDMDIRVKALELGTTTGNGFGEYASLFFTDVMEKVEDGIAYVRSMVVGTLKVGTPEKRTGITLYDEETGDPYCLSIANGQTKTVEGECGIYEPEPDPQPEVPSDTPSDTGPAPETTPNPEENPPVIEEPSVPEETPALSPEPETPPEPDVQSDPQPEAPVTP